MRLRGKRIVFALSVIQLKNTHLLKEIEKLLLEGADIQMALLSAEKIDIKKRTINPAAAKEDFTSNNELIEVQQKINLEKETNCSQEDKKMDLLVIILDQGNQLANLAEEVKDDYPCPPLVLVPVLQSEQISAHAYPLKEISSLLKKKGIFFVPFGISEHEKKSGIPELLCRLDLLAETCFAALDGYLMEPVTWENQQLPH